jgi:Na+-transporting methylmalonyl-CoA/oxaloacetate decarboxylase gamma subunit
MSGLDEGVKLLLLGMGGVFLFLIVMVAVMSTVAYFFKRFHRPVSPVSGGDSVSKGHIAAIGAAVTTYMNSENRG